MVTQSPDYSCYPVLKDCSALRTSLMSEDSLNIVILCSLQVWRFDNCVVSFFYISVSRIINVIVYNL